LRYFLSTCPAAASGAAGGASDFSTAVSDSNSSRAGMRSVRLSGSRRISVRLSSGRLASRSSSSA
jgi:hypothetical protein